MYGRIRAWRLARGFDANTCFGRDGRFVSGAYSSGTRRGCGGGIEWSGRSRRAGEAGRDA